MFEAFAGIGAQKRGLDLNKMNYKIVGSSEWFIPAIVSYQAIHHNLKRQRNVDDSTLKKQISFLESKVLSIDSKSPTKKGYWYRQRKWHIPTLYEAIKCSEKQGNIFDIHNLKNRKLNDVDLLTYSFPCQDLSQQGKQKGMKKNLGTRSGLLWEIEKALDSTNKNKLPKYLLMENVISLTYKNNLDDLKEWMNKLNKLGYENDLQILNSYDFGSPQVRRRAFMISKLEEKILLPKKNNNKKKKLKDILDKNPNEKYFLNKLNNYDCTKPKKTRFNLMKSKLIDYTNFNSESYVYNWNYAGPTLTASGANSRIKFWNDGHIRRMNAREAFRYMGFKIDDYKNVNNLSLMNEQNMIFTCGNSIAISVLKEIMEIIKNDWKKHE